MQAPAADPVGGGAAAVRDEDEVVPHGGRAEELGAAGVGEELQLAAGARRAPRALAVEGREVEHAQQAVLAADQDEAAGEQRR